MTYLYYTINPINSTEYQACPGSEISDEDYVNEVLGCYLLGDDELPNDIDDIRGLIRDGNGLDVYARETDDGIEYFGIEAL